MVALEEQFHLLTTQAMEERAYDCAVVYSSLEELLHGQCVDGQMCSTLAAECRSQIRRATTVREAKAWELAEAMLKN